MSLHRGHVQLDEVWAGEFVYEPNEDKLVRRLYQPERDQVMEAIKDIRNSGMLRDVPTVGRWVASIPHEDYERLTRDPRWAGLKSTNYAERQDAWRRFLQSPISKPYMVRENAA